MSAPKTSVPEAVTWENGELFLLDQRLLPHEVVVNPIRDLDTAITNIQRLSVRGAPAIGIAAAYALCVAARPYATSATFADELNADCDKLIDARPTAINLAWAARKIRDAGLAAHNADPIAAMINLAEKIHADDRAQCRRIGEAGLELLPIPSGRPTGVITHCNAGALAVSELGTATAPMYAAHGAGRSLKVFVDETRPLLQGARLTAWELDAAGIDVALLCDNAAASALATGEVDCAIVGTDRVAANGDVANKIGTLMLAIACKHFGVPFYVACPSSTFDPDCPTGADIPIEHRDAAEVRRSDAADVPVYNPAFDVTPAELVTAFITDEGVLHPPYPETLARLAVKAAR